MNDNSVPRNQELRDRLALLIAQSYRYDGLSSKTRLAAQAWPAAYSAPVDLVITHNEVNRNHGTGVLLKNMFADQSNLVSIRARDDYNADHDFGVASFCLPRPAPTRAEVFNTLDRWLRGVPVRRILCVPYYAESAQVAIAAKQLFGAPLCTYVMDDANIFGDGIRDALMEELLRESDLRLAISLELRIAYETKYRRKFWLLPPTVTPDLLAARCNLPPANNLDRPRGVLIGNIWAQHWLDRLIDTVSGSNITIDWYCNNGNVAPGWLELNLEALASAGILLHDPLPEAKLASVLRGYNFAILPSGTLDGSLEHRAIAQLSLPTRVPFIAATSNVPIIVLGHPNTAAARFVSRFKIGVCCDYESGSLRGAIREVTDPRRGMEMRGNAFEVGRSFSSEGIVEWLWDSLKKREAADARFETLMPPASSDFAYYVEADPPQDVYPDFIPVYFALKRLGAMGYAPNFVIDVGASNGVWSHFISRLFPSARFILVEPLASKYKAENNYFLSAHGEFEVVETALSDHIGATALHLSSNLWGSSLFQAVIPNRGGESIEVPVTTLDSLAEDTRISGRGLIKLDVQNAEHLVLAGAAHFLSQIDAIVIELTLAGVPEGAKDFLAMVNLMDDLGFKYFDDGGEWRSAATGALEQKDVIFVRKELFLADSGAAV